MHLLAICIFSLASCFFQKYLPTPFLFGIYVLLLSCKISLHILENNSFSIYIFSRCYVLICGLPFHFINDSFDEPNFLFDIQHISIFFLLWFVYFRVLRNLCLTQSLRFFLSFESFMILAVGFGPLIHFKLMFMVWGEDWSLLFSPYRNIVMPEALIKETILSILNYLAPFSRNISYIKLSVSLFFYLNFYSIDLWIVSYSKITLTWL